MKKLLTIMTLFLILFFALPTSPAVYTWKDKDGNPVISSSPPPEATQQQAGEQIPQQKVWEEQKSGQYVNKEYGISFTVPEGWSREPSQDHNWLAAYTKNKSGMGVQVKEMLENIDLMSFGQLWATALEKFGFQIVARPKEVEINGRKGFQMAANVTARGVAETLLGRKVDVPDESPGTMLLYQVADPDKKKTYTLFLAGPQAEYDAASKDFKVVLNSFRIR